MAEVWAVTMVRDELDILPYTIEHLGSEGIDGLVIADNLSVDGTWEWLQAIKPDFKLIVVRDHEPGHYQGRKMTFLAQVAFKQGAEWVVPFDADELWFNAEGNTTLKDTFADQPPQLNALYAKLHNYFPTSADDEDEPNPFLRITHRDPNHAPLHKVAVRNSPGVTIGEGNHIIYGPDPRIGNSPLVVAHFPWRSPKQFTGKVINGHQALIAAPDLSDDVGAHWRRYGELYDAHGPGVLADIFYEWFHDPPIPIRQAPAPWCRFRPAE